jgi:hypothetical protein
MHSLIPTRRFYIFKNVWSDRWVAQDLSRTKAFHSAETWDQCITWCAQRAVSSFAPSNERQKPETLAANLLK